MSEAQKAERIATLEKELPEFEHELTDRSIRHHNALEHERFCRSDLATSVRIVAEKFDRLKAEFDMEQLAKGEAALAELRRRQAKCEKRNGPEHQESKRLLRLVKDAESNVAMLRRDSTKSTPTRFIG